MLSENTPGKKPPNTEDPPTSQEPDQEPTPDFSHLPEEKKALAKKLANVGVWAGKIAEVLSRFSTDRIRANFQLYRKRAAENTIRSGGAWLYQAITEGYILPNSDTPETSSTTSTPEHKQVVSSEEKEAYINRGVPKERFHRCLSEQEGARFMYLEPDVGEPKKRE